MTHAAIAAMEPTMTVKPVCEYAWVLEMTIAQLLHLLKRPEDWETMERVLGVILEHAVGTYDNHWDRLTEFALDLGWIAVTADGIDKDKAAAMVESMGALAYFMLDADERPGWYDETVARLKVILSTNPGLADDGAERVGEASND
jgi:hypothetical protein